MSSEEETSAEATTAASRDVSPAAGSSSAEMLRADSSAVKQSASAADVRGARTQSHAPSSDNDDTDSETDANDPDHFLSKGAFLLTPSNELNMEKATAICEKMNFKGPYSVTKTATGILFKFSEPDDYQATFKKGFHKVTGSRFYKKVPIPCRPQKTFVVFVLDVPEEVPEEDIRHSLFKFQSIVEVARLYTTSSGLMTSPSGSSIPQQLSGGTSQPEKRTKEVQEKGPEPTSAGAPPPIVRVTLASLEECNILLQNGLDFYGATFFPTEPAAGFGLGRTGGRKSIVGNSRLIEAMTSASHRVRDLLPVFDATGFSKIPPPSTKTIKPRM